MRIAIIVGTTRPGRVGPSVGRWVLEQAQAYGGAEYELVEVADFGLVLLDEATVPGAAARQYENPATRRWSETIDSFDGFVFVTAEYNHSIPAAFKNAFDVLYPEWGGKAVAFVSYGADGGVRAVEHWRPVVANAHLLAVRSVVTLPTYIDFGDDGFAPTERRAGEAEKMLGALLELTATLRG
ncbi:MAG: NADPH-dependent FMN reductase [Nocardioides sp.]|uniref:NADPH-dependent FMN reductase n=1 Tax=Nocardioides sp. TaxID=35761 RepID=UPI003EFCB1AA